MRLRRIVLKGFKSFADQTEVLFDQGITVVVGPNGCGKSNIVDAFRWVMGEQSAKSMRGDKMLDVIFAGSTIRRPAEAAEVSLTFTEVSGELPVPYDEVEVTRRLSRSGESEYSLNGNSVRQRDIHSLFWDSGLGKDALAIFEQGKIEEIVILSPQDRREIFDQVAGIKRFRERRKEAVRKLTQMEGNLTRLQDILREEKKRLRGLEKQVAEASRYRDQRDRLKSLEQGTLFFKWQGEDRQRKRINEEFARFDQQLREGQHSHDQWDKEWREIKAALARQESELKQQTEALYQSRSGHQVRVAQAESNQRRVEESRRRVEELERHLEQIQETDGNEAALITQTEHSVDALQQGEEEARSSLKSAEELAEGAQQEVDALRQQQRAGQQHADSLVSVAHSLASRLRECQLRLEGAGRRLKDLSTEISSLKARLEQTAANVKQRREGVQELSGSIDRRKEVLTKTIADLEHKRSEAKASREELERLTMSLAESRARQQVLRRMHDEGEGVPSGTKLLLQESRQVGNPLYGKLMPLHEAIIPPQGLEAAAAGLFGRYAHTLVVEREIDLELAISRGRELALTDLSLATRSTLAALLDGLVVVGEEELTRGKVTREGLYLDERGVVFFPVRGERNSLVREAELKQLASSLKKGQSRAGELETLLADLAGRLQILRTEREELEKAQRRDEMKLIEVNFALQQALGDEREGGTRFQKLSDEIEQLTQQQETLKAELEGLTEQEAVAKRDLHQHRSASAAMESGLQDALTKLRRFLEAVRQKDAELQTAVRGKQEAVRQLESLRGRLQERARQIGRIKEQLVPARTGLQQLVEAVQKASQESRGLASSIDATETQVKALERDLLTHKARLSELDTQIAQGIKERTDRQREAHRLELLLAQHGSTADALEQELRERFGSTMQEIEGVGLDLPLQEAEEEIRRLRRELGASDSVNLGAVEEFETQQKGFDVLAQQVEDLVQSKKELNKFIGQLDRTSRKQFQAAFDQVRLNFQEQFKILFNGGEADLTFTDSDDILEAGIDIVARPPGKQMRSITLLSGGEKCLTAMALLFGIFQVKPAPFCILDEMDAPLDDSNIARFLKVLEPFMAQTQFIIVTHNKRTMGVGDRLVGVSMEEKGISKLISVSFDKASVQPVGALS